MNERRRPGPRPRLLEHGGRTLTVAQWSAELGLSEQTIRIRLQRGCTAAQALATTKPRRAGEGGLSWCRRLAMSAPGAPTEWADPKTFAAALPAEPGRGRMPVYTDGRLRWADDLGEVDGDELLYAGRRGGAKRWAGWLGTSVETVRKRLRRGLPALAALFPGRLADATDVYAVAAAIDARLAAVDADVPPAVPVGRARDLTGRTFGRLTAVHRVAHEGCTAWLCRCTCGCTVTVTVANLTSGHTVSCGCARGHGHGGQRASTRVKGPGARAHRRMRDVWRAMIRRCTDPRHPRFADYGGRGITVCSAWTGPDGFERFCADLGEPPEGTSLDRVDNDAGYAPANCRWASAEVQANNRRSTRTLTVDGESRSVAEWARLRGVQARRVYARLRAGMSPERALAQGDLRRGAEDANGGGHRG